MNSPIATIVLTALATQLAVGQAERDSSRMAAVKVKNGPVVDGDLSDDAWRQATPVTRFIQRELTEGAPATESTEVRIVYDERALYIGAWCHDSVPQEIVANEMKRDFDYSAEDNVEIILDTYRDKRNGFLFIVNPNGARYDALVTDEGQGVNADWNGVWDVRTAITPAGWFAEIEIPFSTLRFPDDSGQEWGINIERNIRRKREQILWQGYARNYNLEKVSQAGVLTGLKHIERGQAFELKPYILGGIEGGYAPFNEDRSSELKAGIDLKHALSTSLTLDLTVNTDFAQVEADRAHINLTRFPLFFPEKRDFFLEGAGLFDTQFGESPIIFYSRRIGLSEFQEQIPILAGARVVGKEGPYNLGVMTMETAEHAGEPMTNYTVARVKRDVLEQSYVGFIATSKQSSLSYNRCLGFDGAWIRSDVFGSNTLIVGGVIAETFDPGVTSDNLAYRFFIDFPNDFINHFIGIRRVQREFDPQVGFLERSNFIKYSWTLEVRPRPKGIGMQFIEFMPVDADYYVNPDGSIQSLYYNGRLLGFRTISGESFEWNIQRTADVPLDTTYFFGNQIAPGEYWWTRWELQFATNDSRDVSIFTLYSWGGFYDGQRQTLQVAPSLKLSRHLSAGIDYSHNEVQLPSGSFSADEAGINCNYGFTPMLNLSVLGQWNNEDEEMSMNCRVHWIPKIGSDVYLVLNQSFDTSAAVRPSRSTVIAKVVYWFVI